MDTLTPSPPSSAVDAPLAKAEWRPWPGPQNEFLEVWKLAYEGLFGGAKGPGKTDCLIMEATRQVTHPRYRAMILRRTFPQLQEIMDRMARWYPSVGGTWHGSERRWAFPNPNKPIAMAGGATTEPAMGGAIGVSQLQHEGDKYNHQGREYHYLGFDQLEQFTETQYLYMLAQQRHAVPGLYVYVRGTANPGGVGHGWVKRRFIDPGPRNYVHDPESRTTRVFIPATLDDNPSLLVNDPGYEHRLRLLGPALFKAFRYGDWDRFEGQFFTMWDPRIHVIEPVPLHPAWRRFATLDYGYSAPSSVGWHAIDDANRLIRYRELYQERLTYEELALAILDRTPCKTEPIGYLVADPAIWSDIAHHKGELRGEAGAEIMQKVFNAHSARCGCTPIRIIKADNDRINGWMRVRERLTAGNQRNGLVVFSTCRALIRTLPEAIHDELNPEDVDTTGEDHAIDELRYGCMSRPAASEEPPPLPSTSQTHWGKVRKDLARVTSPRDADQLVDPLLV